MALEPSTLSWLRSPNAQPPMSSENVESSPHESTQVENSLEVANERKEEGNDHFRTGKWNEAMVAYRAALNCLPRRPVKVETEDTSAPKPSSEDEDDNGDGDGIIEDFKVEKLKEEVIDISSPAVSQEDKATVRLRAVLNANIGACFVKLGDHKEAVKICTEAIKDDPTYIKARERRAASNDVLNTWTSLTSLQEDYEALLTLLTSPSQRSDIRKKLQLLKPRLEVAQKRETDEMLGKLKGLGNSILGNFGLSTDNFKFVPNGAGGYSMNFSQ